MTVDREFLELAGVIVAVVTYIVRLEYGAKKNASDIRGLSIREAEHTKKETRMFLLRIASDIDAASKGNSEVKRLTDILRKAVE